MLLQKQVGGLELSAFNSKPNEIIVIPFHSTALTEPNKADIDNNNNDLHCKYGKRRLTSMNSTYYQLSVHAGGRRV